MPYPSHLLFAFIPWWKEVRAAGLLLLEWAPTVFPTMEHVWVDQGYTGTGKSWITSQLGWTVPVVQHPPVIRHKWMPIGDLDDLANLRFDVTLGRGTHLCWLGHNRRLSNDDERLCDTSEALLYAAMSRLMIRLVRS